MATASAAATPDAIRDLRAAVGHDVSTRCTDLFLQHWLEEGYESTAVAAVKLKEHFDWRDDFGYDSLSINTVAEELRRGWLVYHQHKTADGSPVINYSMQQYERSRPGFDLLAVLKLAVYIFRLAEEDATKDLALGTPHPAMVMIADMANFSMKDFNEAEEKLFQDLTNKQFTRMIGPCYVINTPWYFRLLWNIVKNFMSKKSRDNTHVFGDPKLLLDTLSPENVSVQNGGKFEFDVEKFIKDRQAIEGTEDKHVMGVGMAASLSLLHTAASSLAPTQTKAGSLSKKGSGDGVGSTTRWQSRFFVINQGVLMYFKSKSSVCPRRCLALAGATVREATAADTSQSHAFVIQAKGRSLVMSAKNSKEASAWIDALRAEIASSEIAKVTVDADE